MAASFNFGQVYNQARTSAGKSVNSNVSSAKSSLNLKTYVNRAKKTVKTYWGNTDRKQRMLISAAVGAGVALIGYGIYRYGKNTVDSILAFKSDPVGVGSEIMGQYAADTASDVLVDKIVDSAEGKLDNLDAIAEPEETDIDKILGDAEKNYADTHTMLKLDNTEVPIEDFNVDEWQKDYQRYHELVDETHGSLEKDVGRAQDNAKYFNYLIDKYGTTNLDEVEINQGLDTYTYIVGIKENERMPEVFGANRIPVLKEGDVAQRIVFNDAGKNFDVSKLDDVTYVSNNERDSNTYAGVLAPHGSDEPTYDKYQIDLKANKDIYSPDKSTRASLFSAHYKDKDYRTLLAYAESKADNRDLDAVLEDWNNSVKIAQPEQESGASQSPFGAMSWSFVLREDPNDEAISGLVGINKNIFKSLRETGYDAIIDDHDILDKVAKTPAILLDAKNDVTEVGRRIISDEVEEQMRKYARHVDDDFLKDQDWYLR